MVVVENHLNRWIGNIDKIKEWVEKNTDASRKRAVEHLENLQGQMRGIINTIEDAKKPRTIENAINWVTMKGKGSYLALLTEQDELVRTLLVSKEVVGELKVEVADSEVEVKMTKRVLTIAEADLERNIPKKATKFQWLFVNDKGKVTKGK